MDIPCGLYEYRGYQTVIYWSSEDNFYYGKILGIDDYVGFEDDVKEKCIDQFHISVENYISSHYSQKKSEVLYGLCLEDEWYQGIQFLGIFTSEEKLVTYKKAWQKAHKQECKTARLFKTEIMVDPTYS